MGTESQKKLVEHKYSAFVLPEDVCSGSMSFSVRFDASSYTRFQALKRNLGIAEPGEVIKDALRVYEHLVASEATNEVYGYQIQGEWRRLNSFGVERLNILPEDKQKRPGVVSITLQKDLHTRFRALLRHTGAFGSEQVVMDALRRFEDILVKDLKGAQFGYRDDAGWHLRSIFQDESA